MSQLSVKKDAPIERTSYSHFDARPRTGVFGARIDGIQVADAIGDESLFRELRDAWLRYQVLFFRDQFYPRGTARDNTGERGRYVEGMVFPTPAFPSDHGVLSTELVWAGGGGGKRLAGRRAKAD